MIFLYKTVAKMKEPLAVSVFKCAYQWCISPNRQALFIEVVLQNAKKLYNRLLSYKGGIIIV